MKINSLVLVGLVTGTLLAGNAQALEITAVGGVNIAKPTQDAAATGGITNLGGKVKSAYGVLLGVDAFPGITFETGVLNVTQGIGYTSGPVSAPVASDQSFKDLEIPAIFRLTALPVISFGAGLAYQMPQGNLETTTAGTKLDPETADSRIKSAWNAVVDVRAAFPVFPLLRFVVDARYQQNLNDRNKVAEIPLRKMHDIRIMAGLAISL